MDCLDQYCAEPVSSNNTCLLTLKDVAHTHVEGGQDQDTTQEPAWVDTQWRIETDHHPLRKHTESVLSCQHRPLCACLHNSARAYSRHAVLTDSARVFCPTSDLRGRIRPQPITNAIRRKQLRAACSAPCFIYGLPHPTHPPPRGLQGPAGEMDGRRPKFQIHQLCCNVVGSLILGWHVHWVIRARDLEHLDLPFPHQSLQPQEPGVKMPNSPNTRMLADAHGGR